MLRFAMPDGSCFDLDYVGPIACIDNDGNIVAICIGFDRIFMKWVSQSDDLLNQLKEAMREDDISEDLGWGRPDCWDDWYIVKKDWKDDVHLQRSIATAFIATAAVQRRLIPDDKKEND